MQTVNVTYLNASRALKYTDGIKPVVVAGEANAVKLKFIIPESYSAWGKVIEFDILVKDADGNTFYPAYALDEDSCFVIPYEIGHFGSGKIVTFHLILTNNEDSQEIEVSRGATFEVIPSPDALESIEKYEPITPSQILVKVKYVNGVFDENHEYTSLPKLVTTTFNGIVTTYEIKDAEVINEWTNGAYKIASEIKTDAESAVKKATSAESIATEAKDIATDAKETAESIEGIATEAKTIAGEAKTTATEAKTVADEAKTSAEEAKTIAVEANTSAEEAKTTATEAKTIAETAEKTANETKEELSKVKEDLSTVSAKVDTNTADIEDILDGTKVAKRAEQDSEGNTIKDTYATKAEVTDVDTKVEDVRIIANQAETDAQTAITTANEAKTVAESAEKTAKEAKEKIDGMDERVDKIIDGTTVVGKATADADGAVIADTYATKTELSDDIVKIKSGDIVAGKAEALVKIDTYPIKDSKYAVESGGVYSAIQSCATQEELDKEISDIKDGTTVVGKAKELAEMDSTPTKDSINAVTSNGIYEALQNVTPSSSTGLYVALASRGTITKRKLTITIDGFKVEEGTRLLLHNDVEVEGGLRYDSFTINDVSYGAELLHSWEYSGENEERDGDGYSLAYESGIELIAYADENDSSGFSFVPASPVLDYVSLAEDVVNTHFDFTTSDVAEGVLTLESKQYNDWINYVMLHNDSDADASVNTLVLKNPEYGYTKEYDVRTYYGSTEPYLFKANSSDLFIYAGGNTIVLLPNVYKAIADGDGNIIANTYVTNEDFKELEKFSKETAEKAEKNSKDIDSIEDTITDITKGTVSVGKAKALANEITLNGWKFDGSSSLFTVIDADECTWDASKNTITITKPELEMVNGTTFLLNTYGGDFVDTGYETKNRIENAVINGTSYPIMAVSLQHNGILEIGVPMKFGNLLTYVKNDDWDMLVPVATQECIYSKFSDELTGFNSSTSSGTLGDDGTFTFSNVSNVSYRTNIFLFTNNGTSDITINKFVFKSYESASTYGRTVYNYYNRSEPGFTFKSKIQYLVMVGTDSKAFVIDTEVGGGGSIDPATNDAYGSIKGNAVDGGVVFDTAGLGTVQGFSDLSTSVSNITPLDTTPTEGSTKGVTSDGVYQAIQSAGGGLKIEDITSQVTVNTNAVYFFGHIYIIADKFIFYACRVSFKSAYSQGTVVFTLPSGIRPDMSTNISCCGSAGPSIRGYQYGESYSNKFVFYNTISAGLDVSINGILKMYESG